MNTDIQINHLLRLSLNSPVDSDGLLLFLTKSGAEGRSSFLLLANSHHVVLRALQPLRELARASGNSQVEGWCDEALRKERATIAESLSFLNEFCSELENAGIHITVMKSLDHWPDIGNDLDLYTPSDPQEVSRAMQRRFEASLKGRTWGDRLAQKCNYGVRDVRKSVEIHHGCLGQTGEHIAMAKRFSTRRIWQEVGNYKFMVPAPEERIIAATLQRMYRHLYIRVCDIVNTHSILESGALDFTELQRAANLGGVWPGVVTYLRIVTEFVRHVRGSAYQLDPRLLAESRFGMDEVFVRGIWLRVPARRAALLYARQIFHMASRRDLHGVVRLSLLPPLASAARVSYVLTGNHSGIW
jgi:hypothetical protein